MIIVWPSSLDVCDAASVSMHLDTHRSEPYEEVGVLMHRERSLDKPLKGGCLLISAYLCSVQRRQLVYDDKRGGVEECFDNDDNEATLTGQEDTTMLLLL